MVCCSCGLRQPPRTGYCAQCDCPLGALAPPPVLAHRRLRPQRLPLDLAGPRGSRSEVLAGAGLLCAGLGWLPAPAGLLGPVLTVLLASAALRRARAAHRHRALRLAWAALLLGGLCAVPALAAL
jgi:hypothetical protein